MLLLDIRSVFGDYYVFQQNGAPAHCARDTVTMLQRDARVYPSRDVATLFARFETGGLQHLGMLQEVYRSRIHDVELKERLPREWRPLDHAHRHRGSDCAVA